MSQMEGLVLREIERKVNELGYRIITEPLSSHTSDLLLLKRGMTYLTPQAVMRYTCRGGSFHFSAKGFSAVWIYNTFNSGKSPIETGEELVEKVVNYLTKDLQDEHQE